MKNRVFSMAAAAAVSAGLGLGGLLTPLPVLARDSVKTQPMYRCYNPNSGEHFYTKNAAERDAIVSLGWRYEGIGWVAPEKSKTPVYRLYNPNAGDHHYTMSKAEKDNLVSVGWSYEGIGWYSDDGKEVPLYRQYNPNAKAGSHNYTTSKGENDSLVKLGWHGEGIGWYGIDESKHRTVDVSNCDVEQISDQTYSGSPLEPTVEVSYKGKKLALGVDYDVSYSDNIDAGTAEIHVTGKGGFSGDKRVTFKILPAPLAVTTPSQKKVYDGTPLQSTGQATLKGLVGSESATVKVTGSQTDAGSSSNTYQIVFGTAKASNYKIVDENLGTLTVTPAEISAAEISDIPAQVYSSEEITPSASVSMGGKPLEVGKDYSCTYENNVNAGTGKLVVHGMGNYQGSAEKRFSIQPADLYQLETAVSVPEQRYTGMAVEPKPDVATVINETPMLLTEGTDFSIVSYSDDVYPGIALVTVEGKGNFSGKVTGRYVIYADMSQTNISPVPDQVFTGSELTPALSVKLGDKQLQQGVDYSVSYSSNVGVGTAMATVTGLSSSFRGSTSVSFNIVAPIDISKASVSDIPDQSYTGLELTPSPDVSVDGKDLVEGTDYDVSYENNIVPGHAQIIITGKGKYSGAVAKTFKIDNDLTVPVPWENVEAVFYSDGSVDFQVAGAETDASRTVVRTEKMANLTSYYGLIDNQTSSITSSCRVVPPSDMYGMFFGASRLTDISGLANWDVSQVTNMQGLFQSCDELKDISPLKNWDTSSVTNMKETFGWCNELTDLSPLAGWNTSNVTDMKRMFYGDGLVNGSALDGWDVSKVQNMQEMFSNWESLPSWYRLS